MKILGRNNKAKNINHFTFENWSEQNAWALGLLTSDGSYGTNTRPQEFKLYSTDLDTLENFKKVFGSDKDIFVSKTAKGRIGKKPVGAIILSSPIIISFLKEINAHGPKNTRNPFSSVPDEYKWAYVKGLYDGDGNIYKGRLSIAGQQQHVTEVYHWLCGQMSKKPNKVYQSSNTEKTFYFQFGAVDTVFIYYKIKRFAENTYDSSKFLKWKSFYGAENGL
jgi:hypothetical protein